MKNRWVQVDNFFYFSKDDCKLMLWRMQCRCGNYEYILYAKLNKLKSSVCKACNSLNIYPSIRRQIKKINPLPTYTIAAKKRNLKVTWRNMFARCYCKSHKSYKNYGGRGIVVSEDWHNYATFAKDMGVKSDPAFSIDRIDNNGNYCKENCRWATLLQQARNKRIRFKLKKK